MSQRVSKADRDTVDARAGYACELCRGSAEGGSRHHRRPAGMGGSKNPITHSPANVVLLCGSGTTGCHGKVEGDRLWGYATGLLVRQHNDPRDIPIDLYIGRVMLDITGGATPTDQEIDQ